MVVSTEEFARLRHVSAELDTLEIVARNVSYFTLCNIMTGYIVDFLELLGVMFLVAFATKHTIL